MKTERLIAAILAVVIVTWLPLAAAQDADAIEAGASTDTPLDTLRQARDSLVAVADYAAALDPAERIVGSEEAQAAAEFSEDLLRLARIEAGLEDFDAAESDYLQAIELLADREGEFSPRLITAYQALGRVYISTRRFDDALTALTQAQDISQRNSGLFNVEQSSLIDDMTLAYLGIGDTIRARDLQLERLENAVRRFGPGDERLIPYYSHLGDYFDRSRLRLSAREQYERALDISTSARGDHDIESLDLLRRLTALDIVLNDLEDGIARDRLAEALEHMPDIDARERGLSLAVLGDWAIAQGDAVAAQSYYADAYAALTEADADAADEFFATPQPLDFVAPLDAVDRGGRSLPWVWGRIELEFDVSATGRASNVTTVSMQPRIDGLENDYRRRLRETHFRPRIEAGRTVARQALRYTHSFRFYVRRD